MPDVHLGKGATVGSVIADARAIIPAAVGVDIGCGMMAVKTHADGATTCPTTWRALRSAIERGGAGGLARRTTARVERHASTGSIAPWAASSSPVRSPSSDSRRDQDLAKPRRASSSARWAAATTSSRSASTTRTRVWLMLHSGTRGIGKRTGRAAHRARASDCAHNADLPDRDLAVFLEGTREMRRLRRDLDWAQEYARVNREVMMRLLIRRR